MKSGYLKRFQQAVANMGRALPGWLRREFVWGLLIMPCLFVVLMYYLSEQNVFGWQNSRTCKQWMEIAHPVLLTGATVLCLLTWIKWRNTAIAFLGLLGAGALSRELMGQGSTIVFIAVLIGLIMYADTHRDRIATLLDSRWGLSLLTMCFVCYITSQLLDRGVVKRIGWLITFDTSWKPPHSSNLEEGLESLGGLFLLVTASLLGYTAARRQVN